MHEMHSEGKGVAHASGRPQNSLPLRKVDAPIWGCAVPGATTRGTRRREQDGHLAARSSERTLPLPSSLQHKPLSLSRGRKGPEGARDGREPGSLGGSGPSPHPLDTLTSNLTGTRTVSPALTVSEFLVLEPRRNLGLTGTHNVACHPSLQSGTQATSRLEGQGRAGLPRSWEGAPGGSSGAETAGPGQTGL